MTLRLYNTLSRSLDEFEPLEPGKVLVYGCGPTIYDYPHIGNFRTFIAFDLLHRYLEWSGYEVKFVTNLTDVDDKTIKGASEKGITIGEYTAPFGEAFLEDARSLGIRPMDLYPKATDYVDGMVEFVGRLEAKGLAYQADDGSVYFSISAFPEYGRLSRVDPEAVRPGVRVSMDEYAKEDVRDFALWKAAKPEDEKAGAVWDSPEHVARSEILLGGIWRDRPKYAFGSCSHSRNCRRSTGSHLWTDVSLTRIGEMYLWNGLFYTMQYWRKTCTLGK